jgi:hypothetical protein
LRVGTGHFFTTGQEPVKRKHGAALLHHVWSFEELTDPRDLGALVKHSSEPVAHHA